MNIRYELDLEDVVAFNRYHRQNSPLLRRVRTTTLWAAPALVFTAATALAFVQHVIHPAVILLVIPLAAVLFAVIAPRVVRHYDDLLVRRLYREGSVRHFTGPHELELTPTGLVERHASGETVTRYAAVEKVAATDEYTFVYLTSITAHIVPHDAVSAGSVEPFVAELRLRVEGAKAGAEG